MSSNGVVPFRSQIFLYFLALTALISTTNCASIRYLYQAGKGQFSMLSEGRSLDDVMRDEKTSPRIKKYLSEVSQIKTFGEGVGLKPPSNYTKFVQLDRSAAVYVVSACESLQFKAKEWNFPIIGSFPYLGWFHLEDAKNYASELKKEGWDVALRGASAYSTLGWFNDPLLSSMIGEGSEAFGQLVNVILHESLHATLYIKGQSYFNESLANFVAELLTPLYLDQTLGTESIEKKAYLDAVRRSELFEKEFHQTYEELSQLYQTQEFTKEQKLLEKEKKITLLKNKLKIKGEINNATLIQFKTYHSDQSQLRELLAHCHSDPKAFLKMMMKIESKSFDHPQEKDFAKPLEPLMVAPCEVY